MRTCMFEGSYAHRFSQHKDDRQKKLLKKEYTAELNEVDAKGFSRQ